jgi:cell division protein FtsB
MTGALVGCVPPALQWQGGQALRDAESKMGKGEYDASRQASLRVLKEYPEAHGDRALFQMGLLYAHPENPDMDYDKSISYFGRLLKEFPLSEKREEARIWVLTLRSRKDESEQLRKKVKVLEQAAEAKEKRVKNLREEIEERDKELNEMQNELGQINNRVTELEAQMAKFKNVDLTIEKKKRSTLP